MEIEALYGLAGAGVIMALVAALRLAIEIPDRFTPLLAIAMGIAWNSGLKAAAASDVTAWATVIILGILSGLAASGLWSGGKAVARDIGAPGTGPPPPGG